MKRTGNFIYENRLATLLKRHVPMILKPAATALLAVIVWDCMEKLGIYLKESELPLTMGISLLGIAYGVVAALVITSNWEKYKKMSSYVVKKQKSEFLAQRDEKMPIMLHILLGGMALAIQAFVMITKYESMFAGILFVFVSAFFLSLIGLIALELDDPTQSVWFKKRIPEDWMTIDIEAYFSEQIPS